MSGSSKAVGFIVLVLVGAGYAYFFTDVFISDSDKFLAELEYYEGLRINVADFSINDFTGYFESYYVTKDVFEEVKASKQELRDYIQTGDYFGMDVVPNIWMSFDHVLPDLSYDPARLELWVIGYADDTIVIYYWSP